MRTGLVFVLVLVFGSVGCARRRITHTSHTTPTLWVVPVKAASCAEIPLNDLQGFKKVEVRYTTEEPKSITIHRVEFRRTR